MKFGVVNKSTILNKFVLHTLQRNITHLAVITRKTNKKLGILKGGELEKSRVFKNRPFPVPSWFLLKYNNENLFKMIFFYKTTGWEIGKESKNWLFSSFPHP